MKIKRIKMCLYPKLIKNRKYISNKKNGGIIPAISDNRVLYVPVGCGKCMVCKKKKGREWQIRLSEEIRHDKTAKFITFTFNNENYLKYAEEIKNLDGYNRENEIAKKAIRHFLERWRKKYKKSIKHWFITEIGGGRYEHIHIHGLLFTNENNETIQKIWKNGYTFIGDYVNEKTINYIVKYANKTDEKHKQYDSKIFTSAGIGKKYTERNDSIKNKYKKLNTNELYKNRTGYEMAMPIYYRNKIYTEEEKEKLWLEKLDKGYQWINGKKIKSNDEEAIARALEYGRELNRELGYGNDEKNWEQKRYENNRRNLLLLQRIKDEKLKKDETIITPDENNEKIIVKGISPNEAFS